MMEWDALNANIEKPSEEAMRAARARWSGIAKPLNGLGLLEEAIVRIAGIEGSARVELSPRAVLVMCADNGVVHEGVTQTGQEVTAVVTENIARGDASVCRMARVGRADVFPVDVGVARPVEIPAFGQRNIRRGTANMCEGPAMARREALDALALGVELVRELYDKGYRMVLTGEMGIGNTTTSSALAAVLMNRPVAEVTGRGAGLSDEGLARKREAVARAIERNRPDARDALDVLHKLGGLDIAALAGVCLGGALCKMPVLLDGFISHASALVAVRLCPNCAPYLIASHVSKEPAAGLLMEELGLKPLICAQLNLGEGTGAVAALPLLDMALAVYCDMATFEDIRVEAYRELC